jgi:hypothetical protein
MAAQRTPWPLVGAVAVGSAAGVATAWWMATRRHARILCSPAETPPHPLLRAERFPHDAMTAVVAPLVRADGMVDYERLIAEPAPLQTFLAWVEAYSPLNTPAHFPTQADQCVYWLNAYNACVLYAVKEAYPVPSILAVPPGGKRVFAGIRFPIGGRLLTLDELEHDILRPNFPDPRLHFALSCGARGCAPLHAEAYLPERLDAQLDSQAWAFINNPAQVQIIPARNLVAISPLFKWYRHDFVNWHPAHEIERLGSLLAVLRRYLPPSSAQALTDRYHIRFLPFDWQLNRVTTTAPGRDARAA